MGGRITILPIIVAVALVGFEVKAKPVERGAEFSDVYSYRYRRKSLKRGLDSGCLGVAGGGGFGVIGALSKLGKASGRLFGRLLGTPKARGSPGQLDAPCPRINTCTSKTQTDRKIRKNRRKIAGEGFSSTGEAKKKLVVDAEFRGMVGHPNFQKEIEVVCEIKRGKYPKFEGIWTALGQSSTLRVEVSEDGMVEMKMYGDIEDDEPTAAFGKFENADVIRGEVFHEGEGEGSFEFSMMPHDHDKNHHNLNNTTTCVKHARKSRKRHNSCHDTLGLSLNTSQTKRYRNIGNVSVGSKSGSEMEKRSTAKEAAADIIRGVSYIPPYPHHHKHASWSAHICINGKRKQKKFPISRYGDFKARAMAIQWRLDREEELSRQGYVKGVHFNEQNRQWRNLHKRKIRRFLVSKYGDSDRSETISH